MFDAEEGQWCGFMEAASCEVGGEEMGEGVEIISGVRGQGGEPFRGWSF